MNRLDQWLFFALAMVLAPHFLHLPLWVSALSVLFFALRWAAWRRGRQTVNRWLLVAVAAGGAVGVTITFGSFFGREAGISLLSLLVGLKFLESSGRRDAMLLVFLAYFLVMTNFFQDQGVAMGVYMLATVLVITAVLVAMNLTEERRDVRFCLKYAATLLLQAAPLMLVLFVLFPRIPGPLWGLPKDANRGMMGLSDRMAPGSIANLARNNAVAFRVEFDGETPAKSERYWRGPVLWLDTGYGWAPGRDFPRRPPPLEAIGPSVSYSVYLEPNGKPWLLVLDLPTEIPKDARLQSDYEVVAAKPVDQRLRYRATSQPHYRTGPINEWERKKALQLAPGSHPKARALGAQWRAQFATPAQVVAEGLQYFRREPFYYTLQPPLLPGDPVDDFLFDTRRGFCEHYASAFVVLMRAAGIPARVVTGYLGGETNDLGGYLVVRQSDAHAWAEVWLEGRGWVRVDPTGMVSPQRVEQGINAALPETNPLPAFIAPDNAFFKQLRQGWDLINGGWNLWVLGYSQERQIELLALLGLGLPSIADLGLWLVGVLAVLMGGLTWWLLRPGPGGRDPVRRLYARHLAALRRLGIDTAANEGALDLALRVAAAYPSLGKAAADVADCYTKLRYGPAAADPAVLKAPIARFAHLARTVRKESRP